METKEKIKKGARGGWFSDKVRFRCRVAYPTLVSPRNFQGKGEEKYSLTCYWNPKIEDEKKTALEVAEVINALCKAEFGKLDKDTKEPRIRFNSGVEKGVLDGMVSIKLTAKDGKKPLVLPAKFDKTLALEQILMPDNEIKTIGNGSICNVLASFWTYDQGVNKGVGGTVLQVQVVKKEAAQAIAFDSLEDEQGGDLFDVDSPFYVPAENEEVVPWGILS